MNFINKIFQGGNKAVQKKEGTNEIMASIWLVEG